VFGLRAEILRMVAMYTRQGCYVLDSDFRNTDLGTGALIVGFHK